MSSIPASTAPTCTTRSQQVTSVADKYQAALRLVQASEGVGIVYAATVKAAEDMLAVLEEAGESVTIYHGKLPAAERKQNQDLFMNGERRVMVATNAFGMGIDKLRHALRDPPADSRQPRIVLPGVRPRRARRPGRHLHAAVPAGRQAPAAVLPGEALPVRAGAATGALHRARTGRHGSGDPGAAGRGAGRPGRIEHQGLPQAAQGRQADAPEPQARIHRRQRRAEARHLRQAGRRLRPEAGARQATRSSRWSAMRSAAIAAGS